MNEIGIMIYVLLLFGVVGGFIFLLGIYIACGNPIQDIKSWVKDFITKFKILYFGKQRRKK